MTETDNNLRLKDGSPLGAQTIMHDPDNGRRPTIRVFATDNTAPFTDGGSESDITKRPIVDLFMVPADAPEPLPQLRFYHPDGSVVLEVLSTDDPETKPELDLIDNRMNELWTGDEGVAMMRAIGDKVAILVEGVLTAQAIADASNGELDAEQALAGLMMASGQKAYGVNKFGTLKELPAMQRTTEDESE